MRVFVAGLEHETNSFSPLPTSWKSFEDCFLVHPSRASPAAIDPRVLEYPGVGTFISEAQRSGHEVVCGLVAFAMPGAPASRATFESLREALLQDLDAAGPVDAILLYLHGAQMAEGCGDCAGAVLEAVRERVGVAVPIGVLLDLHGNVSERMIRNATCVVGCLEYPHTDFGSRAKLLLSEIERIANGGTVPACAFMRVPMLALHYTTLEPMKGLVAAVRDAERRPIRAVSLMHGFPWADAPDSGASVIVYSDDAQEGARLARELASSFFERRRDVLDMLVSFEVAVARAMTSKMHPVVISDGADNAGGGGASDSTFALHALRRLGVRNAGVGIVWDPVAVSFAIDAGVGAELPMRIGGKTGRLSGTPFDAVVRVLGVADDIGQDSFLESRGSAAGAAAVEADGIVILLSARRQQLVDPRAFLNFGVDPRSLKLIVVKSLQHFRERFESVASEIVYADTPGSVTLDVRPLPYRHVRRPIWPLDEDASIGGSA